MDITNIPISLVLALWNNGSEVTLNDICCNIIKSNLTNDYNLEMRKKFGTKGFPDCIIYNKDKAHCIIEFKLTKQCESLKRSVCQVMCYIYNKYKHSIIPIKDIIVWTEKSICIFKWNDLELLYENFICFYKNEAPTTYWDICPCKSLFSDLDKLIFKKIEINKLDFSYFTKNYICYGNYS